MGAGQTSKAQARADLKAGKAAVREGRLADAEKIAQQAANPSVTEQIRAAVNKAKS